MARNMDRWLGDGGMPVIAALGGNFEGYGEGWSEATWVPTVLACNPRGIVQAGVHSVLLDAVMNFAINSNLDGGDVSRATLDMRTETLVPARAESSYRVRGQVVRLTKQVAFAEGWVRDDDNNLVSRATGTFLLHREQPASDRT
jgi:uncharacterized protein (TIGR00369 family)